LSETVDYNLSLNRIEYVIPLELKILNELAQKKGTAAATDAVKNIEMEYATYDIQSQGFIPDISAEERKIEKRIVTIELKDKDIQWLSEKLESVNKEFSRKTGIMLSPENVQEKMRDEDVDDPDEMMDIGNVDDITTKYQPGEE
jgi:hypothetical protein